MKSFKLLFFALLSPVLVHAQGIIHTIAGNGIDGAGADGILATQSPLCAFTEKLLLGENGNIYFAECTRVRKIDGVTGIITTIAGTPTAGDSGDGGLAINAQFGHITYLAFSPQGDLYLTDVDNHRVRKINMQTGIVTTVAGTGTMGDTGEGGQATSAKLSFPYAVAFDSNNNMVVADLGNHKIKRISTGGIITTIGGTGSDVYNGDGIPATTAAIPYGGGICIDTADNIYIECGIDNRVRKIDAATGLISTYAGTGNAPTGGNGGLAINANVEGMADVTIDKWGNIYIAETFGDNVRKVDAVTGIISTVAGMDSAGYNGDNIAADTAYLDYPLKVTVDSCGSVYISDGHNHRIRKVIYDANCATSVREIATASQFSIYPNPASTYLTISSSEKMATVAIVDVTGRTVLQTTVNSEQVTVDVSSLVSGIYFVKADGSVVKFVKE